MQNEIISNYFTFVDVPEMIVFHTRRNLAEIISKLFQRFIAACEYFLTCSMLLK